MPDSISSISLRVSVRCSGCGECPAEAECTVIVHEDGKLELPFPEELGTDHLTATRSPEGPWKLYCAMCR